jgi:hypothetical protein
VAALLFGGGAWIHTASYAAAREVLDRATLSPAYAVMFRGLWLTDSVTLAVLTLACLYRARTSGGTHSGHGFLGVLALAISVTLFVTSGPPGPVVALFVAGSCILAAEFLDWQAPHPRTVA